MSRPPNSRFNRTIRSPRSTARADEHIYRTTGGAKPRPRAYLRDAYLAGAKLHDGLILRGERPIFVLGPIGSRCAHLTAYLTDEGIYLSTGCFFGTRIEFEAALDCEHGDNAHAKEYRVALAMIGAHEELWAVKDEVKEAA